MCTYPVILPFCIWWVVLVHGCLQACRCYKKKCCLSCSMKKCCTFTCAIYVSYVATCKCGQTVIRLKIYFYGCMLDFKNWIAKFLYFLNLYFFNLHYKIIHRVVTYKRPISNPRTVIYNYYYEWFLVVSFCCILLLLLLLQFFWLFFCSLCLMFLLLIWVHYCQVSKKFKLPLLMIQIYKDTL